MLVPADTVAQHSSVCFSCRKLLGYLELESDGHGECGKRTVCQKADIGREGHSLLCDLDEGRGYSNVLIDHTGGRKGLAALVHPACESVSLLFGIFKLIASVTVCIYRAFSFYRNRIGRLGGLLCGCFRGCISGSRGGSFGRLLGRCLCGHFCGCLRRFDRRLCRGKLGMCLGRLLGRFNRGDRGRKLCRLLCRRIRRCGGRSLRGLLCRCGSGCIRGYSSGCVCRCRGGSVRGCRCRCLCRLVGGSYSRLGRGSLGRISCPTHFARGQ